MKDIINQIIQIDKLSLENQENKANDLLKIKQDYEEIISNYKEKKLSKAKTNAESTAVKMNLEIEKEEKNLEDTISKISVEIDKKYKSTEKILIEKLLNKLFLVEG